MYCFDFIFIIACAERLQTNPFKKNSQAAIFNAAKAKLDTSENKISALRTENNKSLEQFEQQFNLTHFQNFRKIL